MSKIALAFTCVLAVASTTSAATKLCNLANVEQCETHDMCSEENSGNVNGVCTQQETQCGYSCECKGNWEGTLCETEKACDTNHCNGNGSIEGNMVDGCSCSCHHGWTGDRCQTSVNDCAPQPCNNGGSCTDGHNDYTCTCPANTSGKDCDFKSACDRASDCSGNGNVVSGNKFDGNCVCDCDAGFEGARCDQAVQTTSDAGGECYNSRWRGQQEWHLAKNNFGVYYHSVSSAQECKDKCKNAGADYFGMECPTTNLHCLCWSQAFKDREAQYKINMGNCRGEILADHPYSGSGGSNHHCDARGFGTYEDANGYTYGAWHTVSMHPVLGAWQKLCTSCDYNHNSSPETYIGTMSLDECKRKCDESSTCTAIDFGKNGRANQCYLNTQTSIGWGNHGDFDAYNRA